MRIRAVVSMLVIGALVSIGSASVSSAADAFYTRLVESGILAFAQGDYQGAVGDLRLGCFGLLEEPVELAEGLTYLALAEAELGDETSFSQTFGRLLEVERRFQGFSQLDLRPQVREPFEAHIARWIPIEVLERETVFTGIARRKREALIMEMPPEARLVELERLVISEPDNQTWRLWLAELAFSTGDVTAAFGAANEVLVRAPGQATALCLRGRAGVALKQCEQALLDLNACEASVQSTLIESRVVCSIALADWDGADLLLSQLSASELRTSPFKQLARTVRRGKKVSTRQAKDAPEVPDAIVEDPSAGAEQTVDATTDTASTAATTEPSSEAGNEEILVQEAPPTSPAESAVAYVSAEVQAELERIRERLQQASTRDELDETLTQARQIADEHPRHGEAQLVTAEVAYRIARWQDAVTYFVRVGDLDTVAPDRQFYYAVALYEAGDPATAKEILQSCLPVLETTPFVKSYAAKILDGG